MNLVLHVLGLAVLLTVCLFAAGSLVFGLPGTFLIVVAGLVYAWATGFVAVHWSTIGWLVLLAVIGEGLELVAGIAATAGTRPSRRVAIATIAGSLVGGIVGAPFFFGIGALLGALAGAFLGASAAVASEGGSLDAAVVTGFAALRGRLLGFVLKAVIAVLMILLLMTAALFSEAADVPVDPRPVPVVPAGLRPTAGGERWTSPLLEAAVSGWAGRFVPCSIGGRNGRKPVEYSAGWGS